MLFLHRFTLRLQKHLESRKFSKEAISLAFITIHWKEDKKGLALAYLLDFLLLLARDLRDVERATVKTRYNQFLNWKFYLKMVCKLSDCFTDSRDLLAFICRII